MCFLGRFHEKRGAFRMREGVYQPVAGQLFALAWGGGSCLYLVTGSGTGIGYYSPHPTTVTVYPVYNGQFAAGCEIMRLTDLHRPKTESDVLEKLYKEAWPLHQVLAKEPIGGSFEAFMPHYRLVADYLRWFNAQP